MSSKELAQRTGLTAVTITRLEKFRNEPELETVDALVKALEFPKEFFFGPDIDELSKDAASFRSLTSMTAKEREAALAAGALAFMLSDWVGDRFNLPEANLIDLSQERDPARAARTLRQHWALGEQPISNMIRLLEKMGVRVFSLAENTRNVDAFSCWRDGVPYMFLNTMKSAEHSRFDAAHELGHLVLHKHGGPQQGREAEQEANNFASSFLMPQADVLAQVPYITSLDQLVVAKKRWGVSVAALAYRLHRLEILSDWQYRMFCIQMNSTGYRTKEPNALPREESAVWRKVLTQLWSERITKSHVAADLFIPVDEIENLVFGLVAVPQRPEGRPPRPSLLVDC
jgi:Zn-dependent peptidase ImmA (M78 family)